MLFVICVFIVNVNSSNVVIIVKMNVIFEDWWEMVIWLYFVECFVDFWGDCFFDFKVKDVFF